MLTIDDGSYGIAEVAQQVPTVSNLNSVRRPLADTVSIGACAVARDNLDTGVLAKPGGQRFRLSVGQQIHDLIAFQIDQNGSVAMAATPALPWLSNGFAAGTFASVAQSSTASTRGVAAGLSADTAEAAIRNSVSALIGTATRSARRVPASPPRASPR
jgi:CRISPR/Cas system-associated exonuclease Cas4 (RecB family)